ncbi:hypothetical protein CMI42_01240 [Candidatus Pacearchaeota archaeon]|nr:hypothetical protein [Candidatus Pacearchaeota archaeon]|tara:strand:- start:831 stop:1376 length:546 start_codon:yes stop_codon:yes gene_type:complete
MKDEETNTNLEERIEGAESDSETMGFGSVFKSMLPSVVIGTLAAAGCQEACSEYTTNPEIITLSGMIGQYVGGWGSYLPIHYYNNKERLTDENGKIKWSQYAQEMGSVVASDQVGDIGWAATYGITNEIALRSGASPIEAGLFSGITSGVAYSALTAILAPKVNAVINYMKSKLKGGKNQE